MSTINLSQLFSEHVGDLEVGQSFVSAGRTITETDIVSFSALTGDWHPQHNDAVWAQSSVFGQRIAHGMLILSYGVALMPLDPERLVALRRSEAVFKRPVLIGDTLHLEGRITKITPIDENFEIASSNWKVVNQDGAAVVKASFDVVWRRAASVKAARETGKPPPPADDDLLSGSVLL
jgi:acyl dehydratase